MLREAAGPKTAPARGDCPEPKHRRFDDSDMGRPFLLGAGREPQSASECKPAGATFCTEAVLTRKLVHVTREL